MEEEFISPAAVEKLTQITVPALAQLRYLGKGPRFYKPTPRTVLYRRSEVLEWVYASAQMSTGAHVSCR
jgi:predicted DNA-binding transcriptional regulator AlpA